MEHLIRFRTADGIDGSHVVNEVDEAVAFVERLRNAEGASDVRLYRLTEIPIEFKPYYRVEVGTSEPTAQPSPSIPGDESPSFTPPNAPANDDQVQAFSTGQPGSAATNSRRLFSRG